MALTAWETYVEDRITEAVTTRLKAVNGSPLGKFVSSKLGEELRRFHNCTQIGRPTPLEPPPKRWPRDAGMRIGHILVSPR